MYQKEDAPRARITLTLVFALILVLEMVVLFRCSPSPTRPNPPPTTTSVPVEPPPPPPITPPPAPPNRSQCDVVDVRRAGIEHNLAGLTLRVFVPYDDPEGAYANIWTPDLHGTLLKRCEPNEWCEVMLPGHGVWPIRVAAERIVDGKLYQCDRHKLEVEAKPPPVTTTIPVTTTTTIPVCEYESRCDVVVKTMGTRWATAYATVCDFTGTLTIKGEKLNPYRSKTRTIDVFAGCECVEHKVMLDTPWPATFSAVCAPEESE